MTSASTYKFEKSDVFEAFERYPQEVREKLLVIRDLIFETANELNIDGFEETLKWGEPSYITDSGSTVRIAWRKTYPNEFGMFFNCKTTLVETFREVYQDLFRFEGNRAILFNLDEEIPIDEIKQCIALSLTYHDIKHLPLLGI